MSAPDLNLLATLDVLLQEGSVVRAAKRLQLSASAMSRALARLRAATGDPLLARAGRGLVPTPLALALRERVRHVVDEAEAVLRPALKFDLASLERRFVLRSSEGFVETFGAALIARAQAQAPGVHLVFLTKPDKDSTPLRDGSVDAETGVLGKGLGPELRTQGLFEDRLVGVVRAGHRLLRGGLTARRYAAAAHVGIEREGLQLGVVDEALARRQLVRRTAATVGGFSAALALARHTDLIATVPLRHTQGLRDGLRHFELPFALKPFTVALFWHPRLDADPAQRWLRGLLRAVCGESAETVRPRRAAPPRRTR